VSDEFECESADPTPHVFPLELVALFGFERGDEAVALAAVVWRDLCGVPLAG